MKRRKQALKRLKSKKSYSGKSKLMDLVIGAILGNVATKIVSRVDMVRNIPYSGVLVPVAVAYGTTMAKIPYAEGMAIGAGVQAVNEGIKIFAPDVHAKFLAGQDEFVVSGQSESSDPLLGAQFLLGENENNYSPMDRDEFLVSGSSSDPLD